MFSRHYSPLFASENNHTNKKSQFANMDITDITKVASRKRMSSDAEQLREKISRETAKIIKLKVAQDTAYWDLKEKLQQVENNHEKLQQNMIEVQMQYEAISGQYQEELRLRPDTLNKLSSTREICDVLEDYSERLKGTLSRCKEDQIALYEAYQHSGQLVRDIKTKQTEEGEKNRSQIQGLEGKVKMITEHQNQLLQFFTAAKQQADVEIADLRNKLTSANTQKEELIAAQNELNKKLAQCKFDIEKKEEINANLQEEMKKLIQEFNSQANEARKVLENQNKEIKELSEENTSLKKAVNNQEEFTKTLCEQNNTLQEKITDLEDENLTMKKNTDELLKQVDEAIKLNENLNNNLKILYEEKQCLMLDIENTKKVLDAFEQEKINLKEECTKLESDKAAIIDKLNHAVEDCNNKEAEIAKLVEIKTSLEEKVNELEVNMKTQRETCEAKITELATMIESKDKEIDSKASTINKLMSELKTGTDIRSKLEVALQKLKKEMEIERDAAKDKEAKMTGTIGQLETVVRSKDDELSKQMSIILEMRNEKERLQAEIQSMQNTIDNVHKELTRPPPAAASSYRVQPESDDNAVMLTPSHKKTHLQPRSPTFSMPVDPKFAVPRSQEPNLDNMLYNLFSDSSTDGDTLDPSEVNRRFNALARGESLSPAPLSVLRRRGGVSAAQGGLKPKPATKHSHTSLSQAKTNLKNKERTFFKNKRPDNKPK